MSSCHRTTLILGLMFACGHAMSCSSSKSQPPEWEVSAGKVTAALGRGDRDEAAVAAETLLQDYPQDSRSWQVAADAFLRSGRIERAVELYDRFAKERPETVPFLWQRGIALTYAGRFQDAARQFESHRDVNPNDVENAAWHFLCLAKATTLEEAREKLLPAPGDPRPPMNEILQLLKDGKTQPVLDRIEIFPPGTIGRRSAEFYGYLYLGMAADAEGDPEKALLLINRSIENARNDYMGDVTRVYAGVLKRNSDRLRSAEPD